MNQLLREFTDARAKLIRRMQDDGATPESIRALAELQTAIMAVQSELQQRFGEH
jgi:hypothetical protein